MAVQPKAFSRPRFWVFTTYLAEGLPYSIIRVLSSVFFTDVGLKERYIGYLNFLGIPWNVKFLWAPLLDIFGSKRGWMIGLQAAIALLLLAVVGACLSMAPGSDPEGRLRFIAAALVGLAFLSATNDIAIDGYYMEGLPDKKDQAAYTGYRVFAWRLALILVRSGFVALAALAASWAMGMDKYRAWAVAFGAGALTMAVITGWHHATLPSVEAGRTQRRSAADVAREFAAAFCTYLEVTPARLGRMLLVACAVAGASTIALLLVHRISGGLPVLLVVLAGAVSFGVQLRRDVALMVLFIIVYKIGDEILFSMGTPFLMRELHVTKAQYAWLGGIVGAMGSIAGTSIGGIWIKKAGFRKAIWPLTILMNVNIWAYVWLAWHKPTAATAAGVAIIAAVHCYEQIAAGLGNAALVVYILRTCKPEFKASHYAIGSAIMSLFSTFFGGFGGVIVEKIGYLNMFILAFFASIPAMLLLFWAPMKDDR